MSLQVWLPLTKDLRNQGLTDVTVTNNGATYSATGGKLGGCYSFNGNNNYITFTPIEDIIDTTNFSISMWLDITNMSSTQYFLGGTTGSSGIRYSGSDNNFLIFTSAVDSSYTYPFTKINGFIHIIITKQNNTWTIYINGQAIGSKILSGNININTIGRRNDGYYYNGKINDFRLYDHCLSPMEVKQISQGLVLHYPLNRNGWGQENLVINYRNSGHTEYYSTTLSTQLYEIDNEVPSGYHQKCTIGTASGTGGPYWVGTTTNGNTGTQISQLVTDEWYTVSYYIKGTTTHSSVISTTAEFLKNITFIERPTINTKWQRVTFYGQYNGNTTSNIAITIYEGSKWTAGEVFYFSSLKVELGKTRTPWCPNLSDTFATTMGLNSTTEYDCSGFGNNGERKGALKWNSNTPKYFVNTEFSGDKTIYIQMPTITLDWSKISVAAWGRWDAFNYWSRIFDFGNGANGADWDFCLANYGSTAYPGIGGRTGSGASWPDTQVTEAPLVTGKWYHFVETIEGKTCKLYVNGELKRTITLTNSPTTITMNRNYLGLSNWSSNSAFQGGISDFRIYATVLSINDVKSLYQNSAYIDSNGNVYGAVHSEV